MYLQFVFWQIAEIKKSMTEVQKKQALTTEETKESESVDLTNLSDTMVYSEIYNMMMSPEDYIGKTITMEGTCAIYEGDTADEYYYACIISDATACCTQGIEFVLADDYTYLEDYPDEGEKICVSGIFDTYKEEGYTYSVLRDAKIMSACD